MLAPFQNRSCESGGSSWLAKSGVVVVAVVVVTVVVEVVVAVKVVEVVVLALSWASMIVEVVND